MTRRFATGASPSPPPSAVGRMKEGVSLAQAQGDMDAVARGLAEAFPEADKQMKIKLVPMKDDFVGNVETMLLALLAAVGFLLLIACACSFFSRTGRTFYWRVRWDEAGSSRFDRRWAPGADKSYGSY